MSKISYEFFEKEFAKDLEIKGDSFKKIPLSEVPEFDSMGKITASVTIDKLFNVEIPFDVLNKIETLSALYEYCIEARKNNV